MAWSEWSDPISFQTENSNLSENLIENYGAENNINYKERQSGILESLSAFECSRLNLTMEKNISQLEDYVMNSDRLRISNN